ncbi:MAG: NAD(P)/FAD-dependent oxidoreductase [Pseudomonadota bacterium]
MDIAICGCGPSGLAAALVLQAQGHTVSLFERFDAPQAVGSGIILQPTGLAVMDALGLRDDIASLGHRINVLTGHSMPRHKRVLNVDYQALGIDTQGLAVHRAALFDVLYARVNALGITVQSSTDIQQLVDNSARVSLVDQHGVQSRAFDLCVDATGSRSPLHPYARTPPTRRALQYGAIWGTLDWPQGVFEPHKLHQRYVAAHTMIGVLPIGRHANANADQAAFFWSVRNDAIDTWRAAGLDEWKAQVRAIWPDTEVLLEQIHHPDQMTFARYGHHTLRYPYGQRLVFIGDAAHATSPQLGQGANMGLLDAWALGLALEGAGTDAEDIESALKRYANLRRLHVRLFQLASLSLTPFYQSDSRVLAALRDLMFDPLSRLPGIRQLVAGLVTGLLTRPLKTLQLGSDSSA